MTSPDNLREEVARRVDPRAWELEDEGAFCGYAQQKAAIAASLAKADAILSLLALSVPADWRIQWLIAQAKDERLTDAEVRGIVAAFPVVASGAAGDAATPGGVE